jgi:two-component system, sensor histidine kinase and response regulator
MTAEPRGNPAILIVDDNDGNRAAMTALLEDMTYQVLAASSGAEALACLEANPIALILMDVHMPGLDGFDTVVKIREQKQWSHIPVVFLTAVHDDPASEARGYALGAVDYVAKPFNSDVLVAKLRALVSWHEDGEQRRREAEALAAERATAAERERILSIVSHDLRSPLSVIRTGADYLHSRGGLGPDQVKVVQRIQRNADRMARLISDLLDFTRLQNGPLPLRPTTANLAEIVVESIEDLQQSSQRPIELAVHTTRDASVDGDRLTQAVCNLVLNAMQHSAADARVSVELREDHDAFELRVWNEGELKAKDPLTLFQPFRKGERSAGMGLGLYISQQIARAHGGELTVTSSPDAGTTFSLRLPVL